MGNTTSTGVAAEAPEGLIGVQFGDELAGVRAVKDALGEESVGQSEAPVGRRGGRFRARGGGKFGLEEMSELQEARESDMLRSDGWSGMNLF